jgi:enoyl-CoA hydratase/carnithine racemase
MSAEDSRQDSRIDGTGDAEHARLIRLGLAGERYLTPAALSGAAADLTAAFEQQEGDGLVVITGREPGLFGLGADPAALRAEGGVSEAYLEPLQEAGKRLLELLATAPTPTVALLDGPALGASLTVALACDARCAAATGEVVLGYPDLALGLLPSLGGLTYLTRIAGAGRAVEIVASGKRIGAADGRSLGLVDVLLEDATPAMAATWALEQGGRLARWHSRPRRYPQGRTWLDRWFDGTAPGKRWQLRRIRRRLAEVRMRIDPVEDLYPVIEASLTRPLTEAAALARRRALDVAGRPEATEALDRYAGLERARRGEDREEG